MGQILKCSPKLYDEEMNIFNIIYYKYKKPQTLCLCIKCENICSHIYLNGNKCINKYYMTDTNNNRLCISHYINSIKISKLLISYYVNYFHIRYILCGFHIHEGVVIYHYISRSRVNINLDYNDYDIEITPNDMLWNHDNTNILTIQGLEKLNKLIEDLRDI